MPEIHAHSTRQTGPTVEPVVETRPTVSELPGLEKSSLGEQSEASAPDPSPLDGPLVPVMAALELDELSHTKPAADGSVNSPLQSRKKRRTPEWFASFLASNSREKRRLRYELLQIKDAWPLLMKQRSGGKWTPEDKVQLKAMVRAASSVSPYLFIWAVPGSVLMLPFLAWFLDRKRRNRISAQR